MNKETALELLGFNNNDEISQAELNKQYRTYALMYHPDKNLEKDTSIRFLEIKEAYDLLQNSIVREDDEETETAYHRILKEYLGIQIVDDKINDILDNLLSVCEKQSISILEKIENKKFEIMYSILKKYRHVFFLSENFYQQMEGIYERKKKDNREIIELYPTINELMQHMVYKLYRKDELYLVPLWHHELVYEDKVTGDEFVVRCIPNLVGNEDIFIDEYNNIYCNQKYSIEYIFKKSCLKEQIEIKLGDYKSVFFNPWELNFTPPPLIQTIRWRKEGISIPDKDIDNISNKSDIILYVTLFKY
jgi:hypothetical protein